MTDAGTHPRRDQESGNANTESIEAVLFGGEIIGRDCGRWTHVIVEAAVLVVQDDDERVGSGCELC